MTRNVPASVHQRLLNRARAEGRSFNELLQYFALERLVYRIGLSEYADRFVLKGALMFSAWQGEYIRPTRDVDLLGYVENSVAGLVSIFRAICAQSVPEDDGLLFHVDEIHGQRIAAAAEYEGVRLHIPAALGTASLRLRADIGFGDVLVAGPVQIQLPALLDFPQPRMRGYSRETAIAEKLHAMVEHGSANSRMKDFYDIWFLARNFTFEGPQLMSAVHATFRHRHTELPREPYALTKAFAQDEAKRSQWQAFTRRLPPDRAPGTLSEVVQLIGVFLQPVVRALRAEQSFAHSWRAGGSWRE